MCTYVYVSIHTRVHRERCTREIKSRTAWAKAAFNKKRIRSTRKLDLNFRMKLGQCYMWSVALCGAETGTVLHVECSFVWC